MARESISVTEKAQEAHAAFEREWKGNPISFEKADTRLELREKPVLKLNKSGLVIGVSYYDVHLFDAQGKEIRIDPTRHVHNHPQYPRSSITYRDEFNSELGITIPRRVLGTPNVLEAGWEAVGDSIIAARNADRFGTRGTVTTVYATAPGGTGCDDSINATYATARTGSGVTPLNDHYVGQLTGYQCIEFFSIFDTSGIDDGDTVSAVVATYDGLENQSATDFTVRLGASSYNGGAVVDTDFVSGASLGAITVLATFATTGYSATANAFTDSGAFAAAINKTGNTSLIGWSSRHEAGNVPTGNEYVGFTDADAAGTTTDPKLDITHAAAGGGATGPAWYGRTGWW